MQQKPGMTTARVSPEEAARLRATAEAQRRVSVLFYYRGGARLVALAPGVPVVIGREPPSDVALDDSSLSRRHARLMLHEGAVVVEDLGSTNGTWISGKRIDRAIATTGDEILFGAVVASVHIAKTGDRDLAGLAGHEEFRAALSAEVIRTRFFKRSAALLLVVAASTERSDGQRTCGVS